MVQFVCMCIEGNIDVTQAVLLADMSKHHAGQLMPALKALGAVVAVVFVNDTLKFITRQKTQELGKHVSFSWHGRPPEELTVGICG